MTKVTVVSPYHNRAYAVRLTLESVARQTFEDFEFLVWDDGSTDGTYEELLKVQAELGDPRIKIHRHQPNIGLTAGLNDAVARAKGEYIAIVGSGDTCAPERLAKQVAALDADPAAAFCACRSVTVDEVSGKRFSDEYFDKPVFRTEDISHTCPFTHGSVMYRASELVKAGGYEPLFKWCADWDLFFRLLRNSHGSYLPDELYFRYARMDGVSFSPSKSVEQIKSKYLVFKMAQLDEVQRCKLKEAVLTKGLVTVLDASRDKMAGDLRARSVKLRLMRRRESAYKLDSLIEREFGRSFRWLAIMILVDLFSLLPINVDRVISTLRAIRRKADGIRMIPGG